jgi:hypothetical protein
MAKINTKKIKCLFCLGTGVIIGILLGSAALISLISYRVDKYHEEIRYLKSTIEDKDIKLQKLQESINNRRFVLRDIKIELTWDGNDIDKITIEKSIREKYRNLLGKEVKNIDIDMVGEVIDKRIMRIDNKEYRLSVTRIMLTDTLKIWIEAKLNE